MSWYNSTGSLNLFIYLSCISLSGQTVSRTHWATHFWSFTESLPEGWICNLWIYFMQTWWVHLNLFTMKAKLISYALLKSRERVSLQLAWHGSLSQSTSRSVISAILPILQYYNSSVSITRINRNKHFQRNRQCVCMLYLYISHSALLYQRYVNGTKCLLYLCDGIRSEYEMTSGKQQPAHIIWQWLNLLLHTNFNCATGSPESSAAGLLVANLFALVCCYAWL